MERMELIEEELTHSVIGAFFEVYNTLGYGFLEHVYVMALERELITRGHRVGREVMVPVFYKGEEIVTQRLDMVVDEKLIVETKATRVVHELAARQLYNYLRATRLHVGLLLHFGPEPQFFRVVCERARGGAACRAGAVGRASRTQKGGMADAADRADEADRSMRPQSPSPHEPG